MPSRKIFSFARSFPPPKDLCNLPVLHETAFPLHIGRPRGFFLLLQKVCVFPALSGFIVPSAARIRRTAGRACLAQNLLYLFQTFKPGHRGRPPSGARDFQRSVIFIVDELSLLRSFFCMRMDRHPHKEAVFDTVHGQHYTYLELQQRAWRLAGFYRSCGLERGDRAAIFARNGMIYIDVYYAFLYSGVISTSYNIRTDPAELRQLLTREQPRLLFYDEEFEEQLPLFRSVLPACRLVSLDAADGYDAVMAQPVPPQPKPLPIRLEDTIQLLHTGGTTGVPKAAMIPCRQIYFNAVGQQNAWDLTSRDSTIAYLPMFHTGTWNTLVTPMLHAGGRVVLMRHFDPQLMLELIPQERITMLWGVPTVYRRLMELPAFPAADFSSVRCCRCGAAPPAPDMMEQYWKKNISFCNGYGMTETCPGNLAMPAASMDVAQLKEKRTSCGMLMPNNEARIVDDGDRPLPPGKNGELLFRGNLLFTGYWKDSRATADAMRGGWFHTGDIARMDQDGFYYIVGRKKNMYITSGENIFPQNIEAALFRSPKVSDVAVLGVPDRARGEVGKAVVVVRPGESLTEDELRAFAARELPAIQRPAYYQFVDTLPRSALGKLDLKELSRQYGALPGEEVRKNA